MTNPISKATFSSPRALAAWALVAYAALHIVFSFFDWITPDGGTFSGRSAGAGFDNLVIMVMPVLAVLLAVHVSPVISGAKLLVTIALLEYVVALFLGGITLLLGMSSVFDRVDRVNDFFDALRYLVMGVGNLALLAIAGYVTLKAFSALGGKLPSAGRPSRPADQPLPQQPPSTYPGGAG